MRELKEIQRIIPAVWQAFATGDAMGMPTEFMLPSDIRKVLDGRLPDALIPAGLSFNHSDLPAGSVTDDTEQNLYLLAEAKKRGGVTLEGTIAALKAWISETDAVGKHYIGPSSLKALESIDRGTPAAEAGMVGTTCGGIMRTPSAVLWHFPQEEKELEESIYLSLLPTHNTSEALEAAGAYGFALRSALLGEDSDAIFEAALRGGERLKKRAVYEACAPSSTARIRKAKELAALPAEEMLSMLFELWGTGLPSADVCGAVFAIFARCGGDVWEAIRLSTVIGGDTDTIGALAGALCAARGGAHNIPQAVWRQVAEVNRKLFEEKYPEAL